MVGRNTWALAGVVALAGCEVPLPSGAYDASPVGYVDTASRLDASGPSGSDVGYEAGMPIEAGPSDTLKPDAGDATPEQQRLFKLTGDYLVRADLFDTGSVSRFSATVTVKTRTSALMLMRVELSQSAGLVATERFCWQTFKMNCTSGCSDSTPVTTADATSYPPMWSKLVTRPLSLASGSLSITGGAVTHGLGYDASRDDSLPNAGDGRVYALSGGGQGFRTHSVIKVVLVGSKGCTSDNVTRFATSYTGTLGGSQADPTFVGGTYSLDRSGVTGRQIGYAADNGNDSDCRDDGTGTTSETKPPVLRFVRAPSDVPSGDAFLNAACPDAAKWDELLSGASP